MKHFADRSKAQNLIANTIANEVIPSLVSNKVAMSVKNTFKPISEKRRDQFLTEFCDVLITADKDHALNMTESYLRNGASVTDLFLGLFTQCARRLGDMWCDDSCSFGDVTIGMTVLHDLVRHNTPRLSTELSQSSHKASVCLSPVPGQQHIFGTFMLEAFLLASNYEVQTSLSQTREAFLNEIATHKYTIIAVSVAEVERAGDCKSLIKNIRDMSLNQGVKILVGGYPFIADKTLCGKVGADATADNALAALEVIETICNDKILFN